MRADFKNTWNEPVTFVRLALYWQQRLRITEKSLPDKRQPRCFLLCSSLKSRDYDFCYSRAGEKFPKMTFFCRSSTVLDYSRMDWYSVLVFCYLLLIAAPLLCLCLLSVSCPFDVHFHRSYDYSAKRAEIPSLIYAQPAPKQVVVLSSNYSCGPYEICIQAQSLRLMLDFNYSALQAGRIVRSNL